MIGERKRGVPAARSVADPNEKDGGQPGAAGANRGGETTTTGQAAGANREGDMTSTGQATNAYREGEMAWTGWEYLRDRLPFLGAFAVSTALGVCVLLLDRYIAPGAPSPESVIYVAVLACFCMGVWLLSDYMRKRAFYRQLNEALSNADGLRSAFALHDAVSREQLAVQRLVYLQYKAYMDELRRYRRRQEMHNHYVHQWVHQMKTPISVIELLAHDAKQAGTFDADETKRLCESVLEETERLTQGLEMMLHTARLDKFELDLHVGRVALHEAAREAVNEFKRLCIRHAIYPQVIGEGWAETDRKWIGFVIRQLISNAIKYSKLKPGSKKLVIRLVRTEGSGGCELTVRDEGIGMPPQDLPRVFDPFFTGENGRVTGESTGMGLYLARQICSKLGHRLAIDSVPGEGTAVTIGFSSASLYHQTAGEWSRREEGGKEARI
ncbi:sensor histidine kinase [Paenibacillus cisolokensis]|uniref:sensor histidine kinase n=1 Tax=Paenibacillus cisolokensis TaxID=1658519 RepID=UPI003D2B5D90